jgi:bile-acid 7alpha-dehydratase
MANTADLETRVKLLEKDNREQRDIDAIKRVKYKYWRCLDEKLLDELGECFTKDASADYGPKWRFQTRSAILAFLKESMERFISVHHGHNPEIEMTSDKTAKGTWALYNYMIDKQTNKRLRIGGYYHDEYKKENRKWKISHTQEVNLFREIWDGKQ